jgi:hypothetical protein
MTLDDNGEVMSRVGKCSLELRNMKKALDLCRKRAKEIGLIESDRKQYSKRVVDHISRLDDTK